MNENYHISVQFGCNYSYTLEHVKCTFQIKISRLSASIIQTQKVNTAQYDLSRLFFLLLKQSFENISIFKRPIYIYSKAKLMPQSHICENLFHIHNNKDLI